MKPQINVFRHEKITAVCIIHFKYLPYDCL